MKQITLLLTFFYSISGCFGLNPSRTYKQTPDKYNMQFTAYDVPTDDGATLKAWYFPSRTGTTTNLLLVCHNGEGNMGDYLRRADSFTGMGYNVMFFDYRGYGESSAFEIDNNMFIYPHFQDDVKAMIDFCRKQFVQTFDIYGWGIGAGLAFGIGYNRPEIKHIIADTPFLSMEDLDERFSSWDEPMEVPFAGYDKKHEPIYCLDIEPSTRNNTTKQIKLIIGSNDILFTVADMQSLAAKKKNVIDKDIYIVQNPDQGDNFRVDKDAYVAVIQKFLAQ
ncbi:MAG: alpha/beta hydrolase [Chitinophagales bacterium]